MPALKVIVPGDFWDSQVYEGRLYLFHRDGMIMTVDWDKLIADWSVDESLKLALECGFARSDYLYGSKWDLLFLDPEVKRLVIRKFSRLAKKSLHVRSSQLAAATLFVQDNPFPFPHADSTVYHRTMFVASQAGVFGSECIRRKKKTGIQRNPTRRWDAPVVKLSANYNSLALAALDEGLYELSVGDYSSNGDPVRLAQRHCSACSWAYYSIYGSSHLDGGFLAQFRMVKGADDPPWGHREPSTVASEQDIFDARGLSWGTHDKLCLATGGLIHVVRYQPWRGEDDATVFTPIGDITLPQGSEDIVSGAMGLFGTVLEVGDKLLILRSDNQIDSIEGDFVTWRIFPRSKHYENQLHVIYDDRLEIHSFNHDYFLEQKQKVLGIRYSEGVAVRRVF